MPDAVINGLKHHWEEAGEGEPLILVHGAASSSKTLTPHIEELSRTHRVIAVDLRGMGQSERITSMPGSAWVDDLAALIDHLQLERVNLLGISLGARVVLRYAIDHPERVQSLILDNPIVVNEASGNAALNARMADTSAMSQEQQDRYRHMHGDDWADVVKTYFTIRNDPELQQYLNLRELVKGLETPALITRGDSRADTVHPLPHVLELAYAMPNARIWVKPEGGCFATPEGYEVIRNFIASTEPAAVSA